MTGPLPNAAAEILRRPVWAALLFVLVAGAGRASAACSLADMVYAEDAPLTYLLNNTNPMGCNDNHSFTIASTGVLLNSASINNGALGSIDVQGQLVNNSLIENDGNIDGGSFEGAIVNNGILNNYSRFVTRTDYRPDSYFLVNSTGAMLVNHGQMELLSTFSNQGLVWNKPGASLKLLNNAFLAPFNYSGGTFINEGVLYADILFAPYAGRYELRAGGELISETLAIPYQNSQINDGRITTTRFNNIGQFVNNGEFIGRGNFLNSDVFTESTVTNNGTFTLESQAVLTNNFQFVNRGMLRVGAGATVLNGVMSDYGVTAGLLRNEDHLLIDVRGSLNNLALIENIGNLTNNGTLDSAGALTNFAGGTVTTTGTFRNQGILLNEGTFAASDVTFNSGRWTNRGIMTISGFGSQFVSTGSIQNDGGLVIDTGAQFKNAGAFESPGHLHNRSSILNQDRMVISGVYFGDGALRNSGFLRIDNNISLISSGVWINDAGGEWVLVLNRARPLDLTGHEFPY